MALNKNGLKTAIKTILNDMRNRKENADEEFAERLSDAIDNYVKTASIVYENGLTAPEGPVTGVFNGKLE